MKKLVTFIPALLVFAVLITVTSCEKQKFTNEFEVLAKKEKNDKPRTESCNAIPQGVGQSFSAPVSTTTETATIDASVTYKYYDRGLSTNHQMTLTVTWDGYITPQVINFLVTATATEADYGMSLDQRITVPKNKLVKLVWTAKSINKKCNLQSTYTDYYQYQQP